MDNRCHQFITINTTEIIVQVSPKSILVDDKLVLDSSNLPPRVFDGPGSKRIIPLYDSLSVKREEVKQINRALPEPKPFSGVVNFVIDKTIGYNYIKKLMYTAGEAGFFKFNFVVIGEEG